MGRNAQGEMRGQVAHVAESDSSNGEYAHGGTHLEEVLELPHRPTATGRHECSLLRGGCKERERAQGGPYREGI
eukprot:6194629-Pleurochrysis_carterae.AAC.2